MYVVDAAHQITVNSVLDCNEESNKMDKSTVEWE